MKCKNGVTTKFIKPEILFALIIVDQVYREFIDQDGVTITCATDGDHKGHQHSLGYAVDIRTRDTNSSIQWEESKKDAVADMIRSCLTSEYDVVVESTHIHIEFDIRKG